ncbi:MAG: peptidase M28, partial [Fulvivirga sp.]
MKKIYTSLVIALLLTGNTSIAQNIEVPIVKDIVKEANENSELERLAHELMDVIGPRLVGTPQMKKANDWAVEQ